MLYFNGYKRYLWWYPDYHHGYHYNRYPLVQYPVRRPQFPPINRRPLYRPFNRPMFPPMFNTPMPPMAPPQPPLLTPSPYPPINRPLYPGRTPTPYPGINRQPFLTPYPFPAGNFPGGYPGYRPFVPVYTPFPPVNRRYPTQRPGYFTPGYTPTQMPQFPGIGGAGPTAYPSYLRPYPYKKDNKAPLKSSVKKMPEGG